MKVLFLLKYRENSYGHSEEYSQAAQHLSSGLLNSARFVCDNLLVEGIDAELHHAIDNNCIDKIVTKVKPDIVIIEAYWIVPEKFTILTSLHPDVKWIIRNHSAMPFLANEGQILDWSLRYMDYSNVYVSCNDPRTNEELRKLVSIYKPTWSKGKVENRVIYLPNYYPTLGAKPAKKWDKDKRTLDIACFGAIRPLKNQLIQATSSIQLATSLNKTLRFHINASRIEGGSGSNAILLNMRNLFNKIPHILIEHDWLPHDDFLNLMSTMDLSLQVSYSETFNIVTADAVTCGIPVVTSEDIKWVDKSFTADPNSSEHIKKVMDKALHFTQLPQWLRFNPNLTGLGKYNLKSTVEWKRMCRQLQAPYVEVESKALSSYFFGHW